MSKLLSLKNTLTDEHEQEIFFYKTSQKMKMKRFFHKKRNKKVYNNLGICSMIIYFYCMLNDLIKTLKSIKSI